MFDPNNWPQPLVQDGKLDEKTLKQVEDLGERLRDKLTPKDGADIAWLFAQIGARDYNYVPARTYYIRCFVEKLKHVELRREVID